MATREKAADQLTQYAKNSKGEKLTTSFGQPMETHTKSMTAGERGPMLLQDTHYIDLMAHFDRERIPERVVHAKGAGAFGYFEVTHDISKYTRAKMFSCVGKRTPVGVRFSTVGGESGSADTARDPRGYAVKFYTEEGNWDLVGNNTPIFFIRDPILFPSFIHTQKRNPQTHLKDPDMFWDFISLRPETTHQVCFLFSDRGTPHGYRHMNGYGSHTFKLINKDNEAVYVKFHFKTDQGIKNLSSEEADKLAGSDPDFAIRDLHNSIEEGKNPSWTLKIQVMTFEQAEKHKDNPFDVTKVWSQKEYPLMPVGRMVLDRNPKNYFAEVEQIAFCPGHFVPGVEPSPDKMLQGRLFSYSDTHRHRLGTNYLQLPVNCPYATKVKNYQRDGPQCYNNQGAAPNYFPNSFNGPQESPDVAPPPFKVSGDVDKYNTANDDNFSQVTNFYRNVLDEQGRTNLIKNIANHLEGAQEFIQRRAIGNFARVDSEFGARIDKLLKNNTKSPEIISQQIVPENQQSVKVNNEYSKTARKMLSAGLAASIAELVTIPIDTAKVRLQVQGEHIGAAAAKPQQYRGMIGTMVTVAKQEGLRNLYRGITAGVQRQMCFCGIRIGLYDHVRRLYGDNDPNSKPRVFTKIAASCTTATTAVLLFQPTEVVKIRFQAAGKKQRYSGTMSAYSTIARQEGVRGLWVGLSSNVTRLSVVNCTEIVVYDIMKSYILHHKIMTDNMPCHFVSAVGAGLVTTLIASPVDVVKTRVMNSKPGVYRGPLHCAITMMKANGPTAFYKGVIPSFTRLSIWSITMFLTYEQIKKLAGVN